jgi:tetratricopeptide (TPR) repeat protein
MNKLFYPAIWIVLLVTISFAQSDDGLRVDYYSPPNIYRFAEYLYGNGDYPTAAGEYLRYLLYLDDTDPKRAQVLYQVGQCYRKNGDYEKAAKYYDQVITSNNSNIYADSARFQNAVSLYSANRFIEAIRYNETQEESLSTDNIKFRMMLLSGVNYLNLGYKRDAARVADSFPLYMSDDSLKNWYGKAVNRATSLPHKSPLAAGVMSSIIPGSGKIYCGRPYDGFYSLLVISLMAWQAYDGFDDDGSSSAKGWIYGSIGSVFYLGNIYGSVVGAKIYNHQHEKNFIEQINIEFRYYLD